MDTHDHPTIPTQPAPALLPPISDDPAVVAESQARLAAIVESSDDAIVSKTLAGIITSWNHGAERIFGYSASEVIGKPVNVLIPPDRQDEEPRILDRLKRGERVDHFETVRVTKDGRLVHVSVTISPVRDHTGRIIGASKIARDITDQKRVERELRNAIEAAEAARADAESANRAKDLFLSVLSHELRTPLTPVLAAVSLIEATPDLPVGELQSQMQMIRRNVETEARLVDDLLDVTRIARGKIELHMESVDVHIAIRNVVEMMQAAIDEKRHAVTLALRAREHTVWADPGRFQQVLLNLISNAIKFTPGEGTITLRTADDSAGRVRIEVVDNGIGMTPEMLPRIFKAFEQGERTITRSVGGLGLGLSIVQSLVEMHGGTISAASPGPGLGSAFTLKLRTVQAQSAGVPGQAVHRAGVAPGAPKAVSQRVLLVEDHVDTRRMLSRLLTSIGCEVNVAGSVQEAIEFARQHPFDLLVSDIGLPDGSGMDVMRAIREIRDVRGIALSGFGQDEDVRRSHEAGFERHLTKPVNLQVLRDVILRVAS